MQELNGIADRLTTPLAGIARHLCAKSIHEVLFSAANLNGEWSIGKLHSGITAFIVTNGTAALLARFLCLYVFNTVWLNIQDKIVDSGQSLEEASERIERRCTQVVGEVFNEWQWETNPRSLSSEHAGRLLSAIEVNLAK